MQNTKPALDLTALFNTLEEKKLDSILKKAEKVFILRGTDGISQLYYPTSIWDINKTSIPNNYLDRFNIKRTKRTLKNKKRIGSHTVSSPTPPNKAKYTFKGETIFEVGADLQFLVDYLKTKEYIANLEDNWDGEGSTGCTPQTWLSSIRFLADFAEKIFAKEKTMINTPVITRGPNYSIDIDLSQSDYIFAINIAKDGEEAFLYASNEAGFECEWEFNPISYNFSLFPLALLKPNQK